MLLRFAYLTIHEDDGFLDMAQHGLKIFDAAIR